MEGVATADPRLFPVLDVDAPPKMVVGEGGAGFGWGVVQIFDGSAFAVRDCTVRGTRTIRATDARKSTPATDILGLPHVKIYSCVGANVADRSRLNQIFVSINMIV